MVAMPDNAMRDLRDRNQRNRQRKKWGGLVRIRKETYGSSYHRYFVEVRLGDEWSTDGELGLTDQLNKAEFRAQFLYDHMVVKTETVQE